MKARKSGVDVIETDFGPVCLSKRTLAWLDDLDADWWDLVHNKRRRGKRAVYVRNKLQQLHDAVGIAAAIAWSAGDVLREF